jgi:mannose PTS system EIIA component
MVRFVLLSHGPLAAGVAGAAEMIVGPLDEVRVIGLQPNDGPEALTKAVAEVLDLWSGEPVMLLTDLLGGTPFNVCVRVFQERGVPVLTGLNLPMLLVALTERELPPEQLEGLLVESGRDGVRSLAAELRDRAALPQQE